MSRENELTLEVYRSFASRYLMNTVTHSAENAEKAKRKQDMLCELLCSGLATLPRQSAVFEIGSGDGVTASYLKELGFDVTASDVADTFIENIRVCILKRSE